MARKLKRLAASIPAAVHPARRRSPAEPDVKVLDSWPYGGIYVLEQLWRELEIDKALGRSSATERALFAMTANRALQPYSKLYCHEQWLKEEVFFPEGQELQLHQLLPARWDHLLVRQAELGEGRSTFKMADLMKADVDLIFYDTTNVHFEVDEEDEVGSKGPRRQGPRPAAEEGQGQEQAL
jgi:hypothetical protein